jgi:hypothetical protein
MTMDLTADADQPQALFCYRHPDRETYVSCGRCDRPICSSCSMMGPVGLRCRECGTPPRNPLTMFTLAEFGAGAAAALGAGTLAGYVGLQVGFFLSLCMGPIIGGLIAEATMRATGYKRGPLMYLLVGGGIVGGVLVGGLIQYALYAGQYGAGGASAMSVYLTTAATGGIVYIAAALIGAVYRLR